MGGCLSVSCDSVLTQLSHWGYNKAKLIHDMKENIAAMENKLLTLKAAGNDLLSRIESEERSGRQQRLSQVQAFIDRVQTLEDEVSVLLSSKEEEFQLLCVDGLCSRNPRRSYVFSKAVFLKRAEIETLITEAATFQSICEPSASTLFEERPVSPTIVGRESVLERALSHLSEDDVGIIALQGMGGVGKTTLLTQINNRLQCSDYHYVLWITVSQGSSSGKIIDDIGGKLGLLGEEWRQRDERENSIQIYNLLKTRKFVLLLDDIWRKVSLSDIGIPYPTRENKCKIAFTTRSLDVCGKMGVEDPIQVECLSSEKAFELFRMKVGERTLRSDGEILSLASQVADRCCGLPLALNVIGETMACKKTVQEWKHALDVLTSNAADFSGMEDAILPILKYSYDNLEGESLKSCFTHFAIYPLPFDINRESLILHFISEGYIDDSRGIQRAMNEGHAILEALIRASLVTETFDWVRRRRFFKLHDVIRELALWILSDYGKSSKVVVRDDMTSNEMRAVEWEQLRCMSVSVRGEIDMNPPECPNLITLMLHRPFFPQDFFQSMPRLAFLVLIDYFDDTKWTTCQISRLYSLRSLVLVCSLMSHLPLGLLELDRLMYLDLTRARSLESLAGISKLRRLKLLWMFGCPVKVDISLVEELALLEHLEDLQLSICVSSLQKFLSFPRLVSCVSFLCCTPCVSDRDETSLTVTCPSPLANLRGMRFDYVLTLDIKIVRTPCFPNLTTLFIRRVKSVENLNWIASAPNLKSLELEESGVKEIISREESTQLASPFGKLEVLILHNLKELTSIHWTPLPFPRLKKVTIKFCMHLQRLPLDSNSVANIQDLVIEYAPLRWIEGLEWEDEETKNRLLPSFLGRDEVQLPSRVGYDYVPYSQRENDSAL